MKLRIILASITVGVFLLASPALARQGEKKEVPAKPAASPVYDFRGLLQRFYDAWSDLDPAKAAPFYAKEADHVFFDIAPLKYMAGHSMPREFRRLLRPALQESLRSARICGYIDMATLPGLQPPGAGSS